MAVEPESAPSPPPPPARPRRRPNPRLAQMVRTWYFFRRNTLAMVGLGILVILVGIALYALVLPLSYSNLQPYCATDQKAPNTFINESSAISVGFPTQPGLMNGTYGFYVGTPAKYTPNPTHGTLTVDGAAVIVDVAFTAGGSGSPTPIFDRAVPPSTGKPYNVTFVETGLPVNTSWSVTINDTSPSACLPGAPSVCTYPSGSLPPGIPCYVTPAGDPSVIPPTTSLSGLSLGPLPLGSLTVNPNYPGFYNTWEGIARGADWSLLISATIVGSGALIGLLVGAIAGEFGGVLDEVLMRLVDIFLSVPQILLVIVVVAAISFRYPTIFGLPPLDSRILLLIFAFVITWWPFYARLVRGQVLVVREQKFVEAARASGARRGRIIVRHIIPNSLFPVLVQMSLDVGTIPLFLGTLIFLGFGIFPTLYFPEWGALSALSVGTSANVVQTFLFSCQLSAVGLGTCVIPWWQLLFPGLVLFFYALSVNFLSDGLRDALDPRLRR